MNKTDDKIANFIENKSDRLHFDSYRKDQERYKKLYKKRTQKIRENDVLTAFANHLIKKYYIISTNGDIYVYDNDFFKMGKDIIKKEYANYAGVATGERNVLNYIISNTNMENIEFKSPDNLLNVNNGVLNMDNEKLYKHDPKYLFTYKLPWNYDISADSTQILDMLYKSLSNEEQVNTFLECLSTCLMSGYEYKNIMFGVGETNTGKSKIQELMIEFLGGHERISAISIEQLAKDSFMESFLVNKLANISDEGTEVDIPEVSRLKALSGNAYITNRKLYSTGTTHKNEAILVFFCNTLPNLRRWENRNLIIFHDDAFYERCIILSFEHTFVRKADMDVKILEKIITPTNMSALLTLTIQARNRLIERGEFTMSRDETRDRWNHYRVSGGKNSNVIRKFIDECLIINPDKKELAKSIYECYKCWMKSDTYCYENNLSPLSQQAFNKALLNSIKTKKEKGHANKEYFVNIGLKKDLRGCED